MKSDAGEENRKNSQSYKQNIPNKIIKRCGLNRCYSSKRNLTKVPSNQPQPTKFLRASNTKSSYLRKRIRVDSAKSNKKDTNQQHQQMFPNINTNLNNEKERIKDALKMNSEPKKNPNKQFLIRKKHVSNHSKQSQASSGKFNAELLQLHKRVVNQLQQHSKQLDSKILRNSLRRVGRQNTSSQEMKSTVSKENPVVKTPLQIIMGNSSNIKSIIIQTPKQQIKKIPTRCNLHQVSQANSNDFAQRCRNQLKSPPLKIIKKGDLQLVRKPYAFIKAEQQRQNKQKAHSRCKTIKLPWQNQGYVQNQYHNLITKKSENACKDNLDKKQEELRDYKLPQYQLQAVFGKISIIPSYQFQKLQQKTDSFPLDSLKELVLGLQKNDS